LNREVKENNVKNMRKSSKLKIIIVSLIISLFSTTEAVVENSLIASDFVLNSTQTSLGGLSVAVADDPNSATVNPANAAVLEGTHISITSTDYLNMDNPTTKISFKLPLWSAFNASFNYSHFSSENIPVTMYSPAASSYTEYNEDMFVWTLAKKLANNSTIGINYKYLKTSFLNFEAENHNIDIGLNWQLNPKMRFALSLQNILGTDLEWDTGSKDSTERRFLSGILISPNDKISFNIDVAYSKSEDIAFAAGFRYQLTPALKIMVAKNIEDKLSAGLTLKIAKDMFLDVAWDDSELGSSFLFTTRMSLSSLGKLFPKAKKKKSSTHPKKLDKRNYTTLNSGYTKRVIPLKEESYPTGSYTVQVKVGEQLPVKYGKEVEDYVRKLKQHELVLEKVEPLPFPADRNQEATRNKLAVNISNQTTEKSNITPYEAKSKKSSATQTKASLPTIQLNNSNQTNTKLENAPVASTYPRTSQNINQNSSPRILTSQQRTKVEELRKKVVQLEHKKAEETQKKFEQLLKKANNCIAKSDYNRAINLLEEAAHIKEDAIILKRLAGLYQYVGRDEDAVKAYKRAIQLSPDDLDLYLQLAYSLIMTDRKDEAKVVATQLINKAPHSAQAEAARSLLGM